MQIHIILLEKQRFHALLYNFLSPVSKVPVHLGSAAGATENCSDFWLQHLSVFLMNPTQGHLTGTIAKTVFYTYAALIFAFAEHLHSFTSLFYGVWFHFWSGRAHVSLVFLGEWAAFDRETCTVPVPCQAGAQQQVSNLELQLQGLTPDFFLQSPVNWTQPC